MAMNNFEEMRAKLRAKLQETESKKAETVTPEPEVKEEPAEKKPIKLNVDSIKAKLLAKSTAGVKIPAVTSEQNKDNIEEKTDPPVENKQDDTKEQITPVETVDEKKPEETDVVNPEEEKKPARKTRKPRAKKSKDTASDDTSSELDNVVDDAHDYDTMSQVITEHYTTKDF